MGNISKPKKDLLLDEIGNTKPVDFHTVGLIKYYSFPALEKQGLYHAFFTRHGGCSPAPWKSLNFGASVGDDLQRVKENRSTALHSIGVTSESVYDVHQVHSSDVVIVSRPLRPEEVHLKADGMLTKHPNVTLMMRFADCVPILLFDPHKRAIGIVHAGWAGTVDQIARKAVEKMVDEYGSKPSHIIAAIGPSIGPDHYSIREDVDVRVCASFGDKYDQVITKTNQKIYFDLWKANEIVLTDTGVQNVVQAGICTQCNVNDWYSHRGEHGRTGRFGAVVGLSELNN